MDEDLFFSLNLLAKNHKEVRLNALKVLLKICDNIIKHPNELKYRRIRVASAEVTDKLLCALGGIECLFELGFNEDGEFFSLSSNESLSRVKSIEKSLRNLWHKETKPLTMKNVQSVVSKQEDLPISSFFQSIMQTFESVLVYENEELQRKAKSLIPMSKLNLKAIMNLREIQRKNKLENCVDTCEMLFEDLFLSELLCWFKNEFFSWVDNPNCHLCSKPCRFDRNEYTNDDNISRIEIHRCPICGEKEKFVRYTNPEMLLITRKGRCGEWASVFTLMCRAVGYDARIVHDKTDHVWTEVWSYSAKRWIHTDPCENVIDIPLLYEKGWKKKLTYIIAYSKDEIQDVTWRYTQDQISVMKRRNLCTEESLMALILKLNDERQNSPKNSCSRKKFVVRRRLLELAEFLQAPPGLHKPSENNNHEYGSRTSGSAAWRLARGELSHVHQPYIWKIPYGVRIFQLRYHIIEDFYDVLDEKDKVIEMKKGWKKGIDNYNGEIFRKVENDWKMMYLVRSPGNETGKITWTIELNDDVTNVMSFELQTTSTTFHSGIVEWTVRGINHDGSSDTVLTISDCKLFKTTELNNARRISVIAELKGGDGDASWQHAQLFRQPFNASKICSFKIVISMNQSAE